MRRRLRQRALEALEQKTIAFVCLGNICRSPFAEQLAHRHLGAGQRVLSAGYYPETGRRSPELAVAAAKRLGIDLAIHRSRVLSDELVSEADAIFVFDQDNYRTIVREHPSAKGRVHFIGALAQDGPLYVPDPFGGPADSYDDVYGRIKELIAQGVPSGGCPAP